MIYLQKSMLERLAAHSLNSKQKRIHCRLPSESGRIEYVINVLQPGTYVRPHRHTQRLFGARELEFIVILSGKCGIVLMDSRGIVQKKLTLGGRQGALAFEVPDNLFHSIVSLQSNTVVLEVISPNRAVETLALAPREGTDAADRLVCLWVTGFKESTSTVKMPLALGGRN